MRILITGSDGMLGSDICPVLAKAGHDVIKTDVRSTDKKSIHYLDICDFPKVRSAIEELSPSMVIHLAAETDVDKCEVEKSRAYVINARATENISNACGSKDIVLMYVSTAAVFDGEKSAPYTETDRPNPCSVYAKSKFEGEEAVRKLKRHFIIRAGWMVGGLDKDKKFVAKILKLLEIKNRVDVVDDKIGSLTFTKDLSLCLAELITTARYGTYHMANKGSCSRFQIAKKIAEFLNKKDVLINPVGSDMFPLPAPRGHYEVLENWGLEALKMNNMRPWEEALKEYVLEWKHRKEK